MNPANGEHDKEVFDASAILAILQDEPGSEKLLKLRAGALVSAVNAAEVLAKLVSRGMALREASTALDALDLEVIPFTPYLAAISARYVRKGVSLGDRSFLATVRDQLIAAPLKAEIRGSAKQPKGYFRHQ